LREPAESVDVLFIVAPHTLLLDLAGPAEAFRLSNRHAAEDARATGFRLRFAGPELQSKTSIGLWVAGLEALPSAFDRPTWVVLLGQPNEALAQIDAGGRAVARWLAQTLPALLADDARHGLVTICGGALLAARAGLIGSRRCTTHHELLEALREAAPAAQVVDNRVFVLDDGLASSAGVTAGIDLALHLIALTCGERIAAAVAQDMVVYLRRSASDPELSPLLAHRHHLHPAVHRVQDAVSANPTRGWTMATLAGAGHVTPRHLLRLFTLHAAVSPLAYVQGIRLERARQALKHGMSVTRAAHDAGFSSDLQLRRAWRLRFGDTPSTGGVAAA
jgi:transcriptional regulator GlxA family with amidase domain